MRDNVQGHKRNMYIRPVYLCVLLVFAFLLTSCGAKAAPMDVSGLEYRDEVIEISGIAEKPIELSPSSLAALDCVDQTVKTKNSYGNKVEKRAQGPLLDTLLADSAEGKRQRDFSKITFKSPDGYTVELSGDELKKCKIILAIMVDGEPLSGASAPLRMISTNTPSSYWIEGVREMVCE